MGEWISVEDRLPEGDMEESGVKYAHVLVASKSGAVSSAIYIPKMEKWGGNAGFELIDIVYWMPLPEPPEEA